MLFLKLAVTRGPGGPATAITGSNSILVVLFESLVFAHIPPAQKLMGMGVAIVGIIVLSLGGSRATPISGAAAPPSIGGDGQTELESEGRPEESDDLGTSEA